MIAFRRFVLLGADGQPRAAVPASAGETLFDSAIRSQQPVRTRCRGSLICGQCRVTVVEGEERLVPAHPEETALLDKVAPGDSRARLACQLRHREDESGAVVVQTPYW